VKESAIHGQGLFAREPIPEGQIVCIKGGYILDRQTLNSMPAWFRAAELQIAPDLFIGPRNEHEREGCMIFSNHSCEPNIGVQGQIVFVALRDIDAGEELTHDWATTDDDDYEIECRCGALACRRIVTGKDWQDVALQAKYTDHFSHYLIEKIRLLNRSTVS